MEYDHPALGRLKTVAQPIVFDGQRNAPSRPPPSHGEHTRAILADLGYSADQIARLVRRQGRARTPTGSRSRRPLKPTKGSPCWTSPSPTTSSPSARRSSASVRHSTTTTGSSKDREGGFPHDFHAALAGAGWLGIAMPTEAGGAGLGITEAAILMQTVTATGGGIAAASSVHMNIFGLHPVVVFGTPAQQQRWLPPLIAGEHKACFGVTEPDAGLNTLKLKTMAVRHGDHYVVRGQKIWISTAQVAHKILLLARTTPIDQVKTPRGGLSLFYTDLDRTKVHVREIEKMGRKAVDSNELFIDGLHIPVEDRIGEEGKGFDYILHGLNPERILLAAEAIGLGPRGAAARRSLCEGARGVRPSDRPEPGHPASAGASAGWNSKRRT